MDAHWTTADTAALAKRTAETWRHEQTLRGLGRSSYRTGGLLHHAYAEARRVLGRELTAEESAAVRDGWVAERREAVGA